ncbi:MAG: hypothetical protein DCC57_03580 [Chloroflexi bacterium]|nr:MAG: hypothetical protein DCC57_03580 [Chloroflexota bacterium]
MNLGTVDLLTPSVRTGDATSQHTFDLARLLADQGARPRIWCSRPPSSPLPQDIRSLVRVAHYADYPLDADLTILQYPIWFPLAERFRQVRGTAIFWYHGVTPPEFGITAAGRNQLVNAQLRTELAWFAHLAVTASPYTAGELHRHAAYPQERIRVTPLSVDTAQFSQTPAAPELAKLRSRWKLTGKQVLLYIGRLAGNKRIDLLIDALAQLAPRYPNLHLLIVGSTAGDHATVRLHAQLRQQAAARGVAARVTFTGKVDQVDKYLHLADIFLLASQHEGFGVPVVEAMAAGVPVVASASGALPWVLDAGSGESAGLLFPPGDVEALAHAIEQPLTQPALAATLIARGRILAERYNPLRFRGRVLAILEEAGELARQGAAPAIQRQTPALSQRADIALRSYQVRSRLPLVGRLIEWLRINATTHLRETYLDRIIEQQVNFNRLAAQELTALQCEIAQLQAQAEELGLARTPETGADEST